MRGRTRSTTRLNCFRTAREAVLWGGGVLWWVLCELLVARKYKRVWKGPWGEHVAVVLKEDLDVGARGAGRASLRGGGLGIRNRHHNGSGNNDRTETEAEIDKR